MMGQTKNITTEISVKPYVYEENENLLEYI